MHRMKTLIGFCIAMMLSHVNAQENIPGRSWYKLTTGNGHGFQIFDRMEGKLTQFLEAPYRYVAPPDNERKGGIGRRDLMHDVYFGLRYQGEQKWFTELTDVRYEDQSHIIMAQLREQDLRLKVRYFAPYGLEANALLMTVTVRNEGNSPATIQLAAKANLKLGGDTDGRVEPSTENESLRLNDGYFTETGPGGGHAIYLPIEGETLMTCGADATLYDQWVSGGDLTQQDNCTGNNQVITATKEYVINAGEEADFGLAVLFVNDNPNVPQADDFRDYRSVDDVVNQWRAFVGERTTADVIADAKEEFEMWRVPPSELGLTALSEDEIRLWRQSESVMRMGQIREAIQENRRNYGMFLASLPEGEWHIGWVRDGVYAVVAQAMAGHLEEAKLGTNFFLNAWAGFFNSTRYLGRDYRISSVRYYGNGKEEGDWNAAGPNVETDGFGLVLWGARAYLHYSCDDTWLDQRTLHGDTVYEALVQVAEDIDALLINNLPTAECSIWETHWDFRQIFTYTAATQIRGLYGFAAIARWHGDTERADYYSERAEALLDATVRRLVHSQYPSFVSHFNTVNASAFVDGSTVEMLAWELIDTSDELFIGTLNYFEERLLTEFGGYKRLEQQLSLTGQSQATRYDLSQWILLDLRIGQAWRLAGEIDRAEQLLQVVTESALNNDHLIPELYDPIDGRYEGVVPMVGYGAGAWQVAQLEKYGYGFPQVQEGFEHCENRPTDADNPDSVDGGTTTVLSDAGVQTQVDASASNGESTTTEPDNPSTIESGEGRYAQTNSPSLCSQFMLPIDWSLSAFILLIGLSARRRRGLR